MRRWAVIVVVGLAAGFAASPASAQLQTGSIFVRVVDEQGAVTPGVTVTVSSPLLVSGSVVAVTDAGGIHRFPSLPPGSYSIRTELAGFRAVSRNGIVVGAGSTTSVDFTLKVGGLTEVMTITAESPVIDTKSANVNVHLDAKLLETTPAGRDIWSIVEYKVPGLVMDTPDVGGNQGGLQRGITARGTGNGQNTQMLNGVNVGDPAAIGYAGYYYDPSSFEDIQVSTGANDITVPSGGVFINMVTKSGSNRFQAGVLGTYQGKHTQSDNISPALERQGVRPNANAVDHITNVNLSAGGAIARNNLFYFGALNDQRTAVHFVGFPAPVWTGAAETDTTNITSVLANLTYQAAPNHRLQVTASRQVYDKPNRGADSSGGTQTPESVWHEHDILAVYQFLWNWVVSDRQFVDTRVSYNSIDFPLNLKTNMQTLLDSSTSIRTRANTSQPVMDRRRLQVSSNWQYYIPHALGGRHEIRAGIDNAYTPEDVKTSVNGDVRLTYRSLPTASGSPAGPVQVQVLNTPLDQKRSVMATSIYAQDSYTFKRLTAVAGIRWERVEGWLPEQNDPASQFFSDGAVLSLSNGSTYTVRRSFPAVHDVPLWHTFGPRGSVVFDVFGDGKTAVRASLARYYDTIGTGTPGGVNPNGLITQNYTWNDLNGDLTYQNGELGTPSAPSVPLTAEQLQSRFLLKSRPYRNEYTVGVDHELVPNLGVSLTYIHRREHNQIATVELGIPFSYYSPMTVPDPGRDGIAGTADDRQLSVWNENTPALSSVTGTGNDDRVSQRFQGVEVTVTKRFSNRWTLLGGYTWSRTLVDTTSVTSPNSFVNNQGKAAIDRAHNFKLTGSYLLPWDIQFGANFRALSGQPYTRTYSVPGLVQNTAGVSVNAEPRGSATLPWLTTLDLRLGKVLRFTENVIEVSVDAYNVTNNNAVFNVRTTTGVISVTDYTTNDRVSIPQFGSPTGVLGPRVFRINVSYRFGQR